MSEQQEPKPKFFYTTHHPYQWSSGPQMHGLNKSYEPIASLEEAKLLAEAAKVFSMGESRCDTSYGMHYPA